jgi:hypothetical protein
VLVQLAPVRLDQLRERPLVALARGSQQHQQDIGLGCPLGCGRSRLTVIVGGSAIGDPHLNARSAGPGC